MFANECKRAGGVNTAAHRRASREEDTSEVGMPGFLNMASVLSTETAEEDSHLPAPAQELELFLIEPGSNLQRTRL